MRMMPSRFQNILVSNFPSGFCTGNIFVLGEPLCRQSIGVCSGHGDINRFRPWSQIATGYHLDISERKYSEIRLGNCHLFRILSLFRHFVPHIAESFRMSKYSSMTDTTRSREMPSYTDIDLAEIRLSSKFIC
jgi:hypothetical protein